MLSTFKGRPVMRVKDHKDCLNVPVDGSDHFAERFLSSCVPDLRLDGLAVNLDAAGREFDTDGGFAVEVEFVAGEAREQVGFADARVAY